MDVEAEKRKQRLLSLKAMANQQQEDGPNKKQKSENEPQLKFRNYKPHNEDLHSLIVEKKQLQTIENEVVEIKSQKKEELVEKEKIDLVNLAPKKPNWDLKRDVEKKLSKLDKRTKKAVFSLLKEKFQQADQDQVSKAIQFQENE